MMKIVIRFLDAVRACIERESRLICILRMLVNLKLIFKGLLFEWSSSAISRTISFMLVENSLNDIWKLLLIISRQFPTFPTRKSEKGLRIITLKYSLSQFQRRSFLKNMGFARVRSSEIYCSKIGFPQFSQIIDWKWT